ncbi:CvpA family protein [Coprobacter sp.]
MKLEIIDIVIATLILYSIFRGYHLGLIRQIGALGGILLAILGANLFSPLTGLLLNKLELFPEYINHKIAYLVTFLIILFSCRFITRLMQRFARMLHLGLPDKWAGVLFCGFKYILVISVILNIYDLLHKELHPDDTKTQENSYFYSEIIKVAPFILDLSKQALMEENKNREEDKPKQISVCLLKGDSYATAYRLNETNAG